MPDESDDLLIGEENAPDPLLALISLFESVISQAASGRSGAAATVRPERVVPAEEIRASRERQIAQDYPSLIKDVRLRDPLSAHAREQGWAPASLLAEALLREKFRERTPAERATLTQLSLLVILSLQENSTAPMLLIGLRASRQLPPPFTRLPALVVEIRNAAAAGDADMIGRLLLDELETMKAEPLVSPPETYGRLHSTTVSLAYRWLQEKDSRQTLLLRSLLNQGLRARHLVAGDALSRPQYLVGGDERGYVWHELRKVPEDEQALYRVRAAEHLMEMMPDARQIEPDLPKRADGFVQLAPETIDRLSRHLRLDEQLLDYFEQEIAERQHYQIAQPTEIVIEYAGVEKICFYPAKPYLTRAPQDLVELAKRLPLDEAFPAVYHPITLWLDEGVAFGALILARGVGEQKTHFESSLSTAAQMLGDNEFLINALRCLTLACYRDLVVPDVRDEHYVSAQQKQPKKARRREQASGQGERLRFLPRTVYENRLVAERRAQGLPLEPRWVTPFIRRLPRTWQASERALAKASEYAMQVPDGWTFVSPHLRPKPKEGEAVPAAPKRQYRSWAAYDLLARGD